MKITIFTFELGLRTAKNDLSLFIKGYQNSSPHFTLKSVIN